MSPGRPSTTTPFLLLRTPGARVMRRGERVARLYQGLGGEGYLLDGELNGRGKLALRQRIPCAARNGAHGCWITGDSLKRGISVCPIRRTRYPESMSRFSNVRELSGGLRDGETKRGGC